MPSPGTGEGLGQVSALKASTGALSLARKTLPPFGHLGHREAQHLCCASVLSCSPLSSRRRGLPVPSRRGSLSSPVAILIYNIHLLPPCCSTARPSLRSVCPACDPLTRDREFPSAGELALCQAGSDHGVARPLGDGGDSSLELSLGLPAYFAKPSSSSGLDAAGEEPGDAADFALQAAKGSNDGSKARSRPAAAAPVVGWPPVGSFRRNLASRPSPQSSSGHRHHHHNQDGGAKDGDKGGLFVKINMDGVPIGRKVDLRAYAGYADLSAAVGKLFRGLVAAAAQRDPVAATGGEEEVQEPVIGGDCTLVYEDDEGDRVLVGDVPWEMFVATAKRLRVLKSSDVPTSSVSRKRAAADC